MRHPTPFSNRWLLLASLAMLWMGVSLASGQSSEPTLTAWGTASGVEAFRPGKWTVVRSTVTNPSEQPSDVLVAHFFAEQPLIQFATRLTLPPRSRRDVQQLIRIPDAVTGDSVTIQTLLLDPAASPERVFENSRQTGTLILSGDGPVTAMLCDEEDDEAIDFAGLIRRSADFKPTNQLLRLDALPSDAAGYEALDALFISAARPRLDPAQLAALRTWLIGGGRAWVMLDQVECDFLDALLREDSLVQEIARVPLTTVSFDEYPRRGHDFDPPVTMTRVLPGGAQVIHHVQKWPASLRLSIGRGTVIVTTLSPRAWRDGRYKTLEPLQELAAAFLYPDDKQPLTKADFEPLARHQTAYTIVGRGHIVAGMTALLLVILVPGGWLVMRRQGEWSALLATTASIALALYFVALGAMSRKQSPPAIAWATLAFVSPSQREAVVQGLASIYTPHEGIGPVQSRRGGVAWPVMETLDGSLLRLTWTDGDKWQWRNLSLPPGAVRLFHVNASATSAVNTTATATFNESGVVGTLPPELARTWENPSLLTPRGLVPLHANADGGFVIDDSQPQTDPATPTEAAKRAAEIGRLLAGRFSEPLLVGWAPPVDVGISVPQDIASRGGTVAVMPLRFVRPAPGARFHIPSQMIGMKSSPSPTGELAIPIFNAASGEWTGPHVTGGEVTLRMTLPPSLSPMRLDRLAIIMDIQSPGRDVELITYQGQNRTSAKTWQSPEGYMSANLEADTLPSIDAEGSFYLTLRIGQPVTEQDNPWMIRGMSIELWGVTLTPDQPPAR